MSLKYRFVSCRPRQITRFLMLILLLTLFASGAAQAQDEPTVWTNLFTYQDPQTLLANRGDEDIVIMATGDVLLARSINARMIESNDFTFPFKHVGHYLSQADISWVNLETPLVTPCPIRYGSVRFCGDPRNVEALTSAGIDVVNLANNHTENHSEEGVYETVQHLTDADIAITGLTDPVIMEIHGKTIGLVCFNDITPTTVVIRALPEVITPQMESLRSRVDYLLVCFHWGEEYTLEQTNRQRKLAKLAIDLGADVVVGHHPHWLQGVELYEGKPIIYSLGNFIFDQKVRGWVNDGAIAYIDFQAEGDLKIHFLPVVIEDESTPRFATQKEAEVILKRMSNVSKILEP